MTGKRKSYSTEFKQHAIEKLNSGQYTLRDLASELNVSVPTLLKWRQGDKRATSRNTNEEQGIEIMQLRREIAQLIEERDRLRKGIAVLAGVTD